MDSKTFEAVPFPQEPSPRQVEHTAHDFFLPRLGQVWIRQIDTQLDVIFFDS